MGESFEMHQYAAESKNWNELPGRQAVPPDDSMPMFGSGQFSTDWPGFQFQVNSTSSVINQLRFATSKSIRQSGIILASFNAAAGLVLAAGILWDCYRAARRADPKLKFMYAQVSSFVGFGVKTNIKQVINVQDNRPNEHLSFCTCNWNHGSGHNLCH